MGGDSSERLKSQILNEVFPWELGGKQMLSSCLIVKQLTRRLDI